MAIALTREIRFGLHESVQPPVLDQANGFAGNPPLLGLAPFLVLSATISGEIDQRAGILLNIKQIDDVLRQLAVPKLRDYYFGAPVSSKEIPRGGGDALAALLEQCAPAFLPNRLEAMKLSLSPFLTLTAQAKDTRMVRLSLRFEFSASHRLHSDALSTAENQTIFGRCNSANGHGHNYELEVTVAGPPDSAGHVIPILELQKVVNEHIVTPFDHKHLNLDCPDFQKLNPTVENIAQVLYRRLRPHIPQPARLASLRVWETPKTMCEYSE